MPKRSGLALAICASLALAALAVANDGGREGPSDIATPSVALGDLTFSDAFMRATLPNQPVGGGFLSITNSGVTDDVLIGVSADFAKRGEVHKMAMQSDVMQMRRLDHGLVIPAGETVTLQPGGFHLMFMGLEAPLIEGETVSANLEFEHAGSITLAFRILSKNARVMENADQGS